MKTINIRKREHSALYVNILTTLERKRENSKKDHPA